MQRVGALGYTTSLVPQYDAGKTYLHVSGMMSADCGRVIRDALLRLDGVNGVDVDVLKEEVQVEFDSDIVGVRKLVRTVEEIGYGCTLMRKEQHDTQAQQEQETEYYKRTFLLSLFFAIPTFIFGMIVNMADREWMEQDVLTTPRLTMEAAILWPLATPMQFWLGLGFYTRSYAALRQGNATMDVLVCLGTSVAYFYSVGAIFYGMVHTDFQYHLFFEASVVVMTFIFLGHYLQHYTRAKTSAAIQALMSLQAESATLLVPVKKEEVSSEEGVREGSEGHSDSDENSWNQYTEERIPVELLEGGDLIKVVPGERVAADGRVVYGTSHVDEAMITGESLPVKKVSGIK